MDKGEAFGFFMTADHLRKSPRDIDGNERPIAPTWTVVRDQANKWNELKEKGKYFGKIYYLGFEWDMFGHDYASVAILGDNPKEIPVGAHREFEWLFSYDAPTEAFSGREEDVWQKAECKRRY